MCVAGSVYRCVFACVCAWTRREAKPTATKEYEHVFLYGQLKSVDAYNRQRKPCYQTPEEDLNERKCREKRFKGISEARQSLQSPVFTVT